MKVKLDRTEADVLRRLDEAARAERRERFRQTTMADRLETSFELSDLARELRAGVTRAK